MDYFETAVSIVRQHGASTLATAAISKAKRKARAGEDVCTCGAYPFPHRSGGGDCTAPDPFACPRCHGISTDEDGEKVRCTYCRGAGREA